MDRKNIPGATPFDPSGLRPGIERTREAVWRAEAENVALAVEKYLARRLTRRSAPFDYAWALKLHREMLGKVWRWAGTTRRHDVNPGVDWEQVEPALFALLADLRAWEASGLPVADQAVLLHHRAVQIHPFQDGNGRWSRLLANVWLRLHGVPWIPWDDGQLRDAASPFRAEYLAAMQAADRGDYEPLAALHARHTPP